MIFSELYGAYYHTVAEILKEAVAHPVSEEMIQNLVKKYAFSESAWVISEALKEERWQLLKEDGTTPITNEPSMPLTILQKRWLKSLLYDPRIQLFGPIVIAEDDVEPLFYPTDYILFDQYSDGDDYTDETYIANFRLILDAIKKKHPLMIEITNRHGESIQQIVVPEYLEYSEKDDKFRLIGCGNRLGSTINLGRIVTCKVCENEIGITKGKRNPSRPRTVRFELKNERNALERVLLHFAHFEKTVERMDENSYTITIHYDKEDETELLIRVLSFGPMIKVVAPIHFIELIKKRLIDQKKL